MGRMYPPVTGHCQVKSVCQLSPCLIHWHCGHCLAFSNNSGCLFLCAISLSFGFFCLATRGRKHGFCVEDWADMVAEIRKYKKKNSGHHNCYDLLCRWLRQHKHEHKHNHKHKHKHSHTKQTQQQTNTNMKKFCASMCVLEYVSVCSRV